MKVRDFYDEYKSHPFWSLSGVFIIVLTLTLGIGKYIYDNPGQYNGPDGTGNGYYSSPAKTPKAKHNKKQAHLVPSNPVNTPNSNSVPETPAIETPITETPIIIHSVSKNPSPMPKISKTPSPKVSKSPSPTISISVSPTISNSISPSPISDPTPTVSGGS